MAEDFMKFNNILALVAIVAFVGIYIDLRRTGVLFGSDTVISQDTVIVNLPAQTFQLPPGHIHMRKNEVKYCLEVLLLLAMALGLLLL